MPFWHSSSGLSWERSKFFLRNYISTAIEGGFAMAQSLTNTVQSIAYRCIGRFNKPAVANPTWPLDHAALAEATVFWPVQYGWAPSEGFLEPVRHGIAHWARVERRRILQPYAGVCVFELQLNDATHRIAIDYSDYVNRIERDCLSTVSLYFKMQCLRAGYDLPLHERRKIIPGGYVTADRRLTYQLPAIRKAAQNAPPLFNIYGRFGLEFARQIRTSVVHVLSSDPALGYEGGLRKVPYRQSVIDASRSKICIDLPGNGDFCFRLLDYLSVGAFVIAYPHRTTLPVPLLDRFHIVYMKPDLSDLLDLCRYYLDRPEERREIQSNAAAYFDACCNYAQLGSYYLQHCLNMATAASAPSVAASLPQAPRRRSAA